MNDAVLDISLQEHKMIVWTRHGRWNQEFLFTSQGEIRNAGLKRHLDVKGGSRKKGAELVFSPPEDSWSQRWMWTEEGYIENPDTGLVLDIFGSDPKRGAQVGLWTRHSGLNQKWSLRRVRP